MKYAFLVVSLMLLATELSGQWMISMNEDSLLTVLKNEKDTTAVRVLLQLAGSYFFKQPSTSLAYAKAALDSSRRLNSEVLIIQSSLVAGEASRLVGDYVGGLKIQYGAIQRARKVGNKNWEANLSGGIGMNYFDQERLQQSYVYLKRAVTMHKAIPPDEHEPLYNAYLARYHIATKTYDSGHYYLKEAAQYFHIKAPPGRTVRWRMVYHIAFGDYYFDRGRTDSAFLYYKIAINIAANPRQVVLNHVSLTSIKLSKVYTIKGQLDSSLYFARHAFTVATGGNFKPRIRDASRQLADVYRKLGNSDSALYYHDIAFAVNDDILGTDKVNELQLLQLEEQKRTLEIQQAEEQYQNKLRLISLVSITAIILVASLLLFRSNRIKQKTNIALQQTLKELKATQSQLIQSEKMASLGELTAGIAHEIQNPLNFVNNFSELNRELIDELNQNAKEGRIDAIQKLATDIKENEEKIEHHGKRADAIVKSMLQHSRTSTGQKEVTDINVLCDEYLRLAYHGFRAKDKSFNTTIEKSLDPSIPKLNMVAQDIGRVMLNLINNAFYAVNERAKVMDSKYTPTVNVSTRRLENVVEITVEDNGGGIPDEIKSKIFQPFFTTKPAGQGTGLGLSLAYDIVVKGHGGQIKVETRAGQMSSFTITLNIA